MGERADAEKLAAARQFVLVVRIVVRANGRISGEIVDSLEAKRRRFVGIAALQDAIERWIREEINTGDDN